MPPSKVRIGEETFLIVQSRDVIELHDRVDARRLLERLVHDRHDLRTLRDLLEDLDPFAFAMTDRDVLAGAEALLASGRVVGVRVRAPARPLDRPEIRPLVDPGDPSTPDEPLRPRGRADVTWISTPEPDWTGLTARLPSQPAIDEPRDVPVAPLAEPTYLELTVVHETGGLYAFAELEVELPDGEVRTVKLDLRSHVRIDDITGSGGCRVRVASPLSLADAEYRRPSTEEMTSTAGTTRLPPTDASWTSLRTGTPHRLVVARPAMQRTLSFAGAIFAFDSAFPTPGVASMLRHTADLVAAHPDAKLGLFGHCDPTGSDDYNKALSDRRAILVLSLMTGDLDLFEEVAEGEDWGLAEYQVMLRALGNNPGAIDGELGDLTRAAIAAFRDEYGRDVHHASSVRKRAHGSLSPGDGLDADTKRAIRDAYHALHAMAIPQSAFVGPKVSGCGEFNPLSLEDPAKNRRVTLAIYGEDAPTEFPCEEGNAAACPLDERGQSRCRFYREHFAPPTEPEPAFPFCDGQWLPTPTGKAHLSVLTVLDDTDEAELQVQLAPRGRPAEDHGDGVLPAVGPIVARLPALIRAGVAYGLWDPGEHYDPFDVRHWFRAPEDDPAEHPWLREYQPPAFGIAAHGVWCLVGPPSHPVEHTSFSLSPRGPATVLLADGRVLHAALSSWTAIERDLYRQVGLVPRTLEPWPTETDAEEDA
jgi:hypothetical protein